MSQGSIKSSRRLSRLKTSRDDSKVSTITEESAAALNFRATLTEEFFQSIYHTLLVNEKLSLKTLSEGETPSTRSLDTTESLSDSNNSRSSSNPSCASNCPCVWRITFKNGNIYEGQTNERLMEGNGTFYWTDSSVYRGDFKNGYPWGKGTLTLPDLSCYKGDFNCGFLHGHGSLNVKSTMLLYCGEWRLSNRNGKGWLHYDQNNVYEGEWVNNQKHGIGIRRYKNRDTYQGSWIQDRINGDGAMMWHNGDYYEGQWCDGYQHGYGEYTWSLTAHNQLVFLNYNWYKGNWVNGFRSGAGIMNFGHESGAKLAGTWMDNLKHGPGVMICGNGVILEKNPLFTDDKPSAYAPHKTSNADCALRSQGSALTSFVSISKQILSKVKLATLDDEPLTSINLGSTNIKMKQYIKLLERNTGNAPPLKIPIHHVVHEVDLEYFEENFFKKGSGDSSSTEIDELKTKSDNGPSGCANSLPATGDLRNLIINYLPSLRDIYNTYATVCCPDRLLLTCKPVLVRLFLWQLYRDVGVTDKNGVSIVEVDEMLMRNPKGCLETTHDPWEPIYFWQFIQAMVGLAGLLFSKDVAYNNPCKGSAYFMFKNFLDHRLLPRFGRFQGNSLNYLKDLVPIGSVYELYKEIGEPHTVETFLKNSCLKKGQSLPCYKLLAPWMGIKIGKNLTTLNNQLLFQEDPAPNGGRNKPEGLHAFAILGRKTILASIAKICPPQLQYRLSFLEFYEVVLLLAYRKTEQDRTAPLDVPHVKSQNRGLPRTSELFNAKRKNKLKK